ncbi:MAG: OmpA family protein [Bacteroidota bacterium]
MKKITIMLALLLTIGIGASFAQPVTDYWTFGFGLTYPRFSNVNIQPLNSNYGGFLSLEKNFSENVGLRFKTGYTHQEGEWKNSSLNMMTVSTKLVTGDLDLLYYVLPCEPVSPYLFAGGGVSLRMLSNWATPTLDENETALSFNVGGGVEWAIGSNLKIMTEYGFHKMFNSELDGAVVPTEANGRDAYMTLNLGLQFVFGKGAPSKLCEPCQGITQVITPEKIDYDRIEELIIEHIPKIITRDVVVDKYIVAVNDRIVLVGVNFAFDKAELQPESYPVLDKAVTLLTNNPEVNVEVEGYCDYIGSNAYNKELSVNRAITVKSYLVSKGIADSRLRTVGYGEQNPVANNKTEDGRAMNRRIVFRIMK